MDATLCFNCWEWMSTDDVLSPVQPRCPNCNHKDWHEFIPHKEHNGNCARCGRYQAHIIHRED